MSEYWKSLPRKFCDVCKCWFADNKASIDFHEKGKRHQDNVQKQIRDIQRRGIKEHRKELELQHEMARIERAAIHAYHKDIINKTSLYLSPAVAPKPSIPVPDVFVWDLPKSKILEEKNQHKPPKRGKGKRGQQSNKKWYEGITEDGDKYYWNVKNSKSQWEPPNEPYISLEEQNQIPSTSSVQQKKKEPLEAEFSYDTFGPQEKSEPLGKWVAVKEKVEKVIDFELPKPSEDIVEVVIQVPRDEEKLKIKEKVIGQLPDTDSSEKVTFKKRKVNASAKRNVRQRTDDD